jgi:transposase-like protein
MSKPSWRSAGARSTTRPASAGSCQTVPRGQRRCPGGSARGGSWRIDATSSKSKGRGYARARAVEKTGQTLACLRTALRDEPAAPRFLPQARRRHGVPATPTIDGSPAHEAAIKSEKAAPGTAINIRQSTSRHPLVEPDQRGVKRGTRPMLGCQSVAAAQDTGGGIARMPRTKKKPMVVETGEEGRTAAAPCDSLAASSPHRSGQRPRHDLLSKICDKTP